MWTPWPLPNEFHHSSLNAPQIREQSVKCSELLNNQFYDGRGMGEGGKGLGWALICRLCRFSWCKYSHHCRSQATRAKSLNQVEETRHNVAQSVISWTPNRLQPGTGGKRKSTSWSCGSQPQLSRIITQEFWRILMPRSHPKPMRSDSLGWDPGMCVVRTLPQPQSRSTGWHRACLVLSFAKFQPILSRHHIFLH